VLAVLRQRKRRRPAGSYTASLFAKGTPEILKKIGEEAFETSLAALGRSRRALIAEVADLWFHTLVLLADQGIRLDEVLRELERRRKAPRRAAK
jgi:phosphoribosyl-ATP pyrophosphohydrolase